MTQSRTVALLAAAITTVTAALQARTAHGRAVENALSASEILDRGFSSIGGRDEWRALQRVRVDFLTSSFAFGQDAWPGAPIALGASIDGNEVRDYARPGLLSRYHIANSAPKFTRVFLRDSAAFMFDTSYAGFGGGTPMEGYKTIWRNDPIRLLRVAALATNDQLRSLGNARRFGQPVVGVSVQSAEDTIQLWFDAESELPLAIDRSESDAVFVTRLTRIGVAAWAPAGPLRIPVSYTASVNDQIIETWRLQSPRVNVDVDSVFASVRKTAGSVAPATMAIVDIAPGIHRVEAASAGVPYNVLFAEQGDSIVLVDPPIDDAYTKAVIDSIRARFPRSRSRTFVVTHHHSDHLGGARAAFAAGMNAIAPSEIVQYVRNVGVGAGEKAPSRKVTAVRDSLAVGSGPGRFVLYRVPNSHARSLIMAYFPEAKLLAEVDLAAGTLQDRADLYAFLQKSGLAVDRLARMHGTVMTWDSYLKGVPGRPRN